MDLMTDLQMPTPAELAAHLAHAANSTANHNQPPYDEMIIAAVSAQKEKDGSSRQAIAKYIEQHYPNLPPTHPTLLTNHLKQLKNNGQLIMIKHSYALPRSDNYSFAEDFPQATATPDSSAKRKPGRPPKALFQQQGSVPVAGAGFGAEPQGYSGAAAPGYTPEFQGYSMSALGFGADVQSYQMGAPAPGFGSDAQAYQMGAPGTGHDVQHYPGSGPEPMFVSLGLDDGPVALALEPPPVGAESESTPTTVTKRGRGRPPKGSSTTGQVEKIASGRPTSLGKRSRGRPAKPRSITEILSNGGLKPKTGRGRAKLTGPVIVPLAGGSPTPKSGPNSSGRPRGRPRKIGGAGVVVPIEGGPVAARKSGRPARIGVARKLYGKAVGRPRKNSAVTAIIVTDPHQLVAYQELKSKYEHIQLKIKQAASLLRPCLNHEDAMSALGALQELEALASAEEVNNAPPVNVQSQEPPQQLHDHQENLF